MAAIPVKKDQVATPLLHVTFARHTILSEEQRMVDAATTAITTKSRDTSVVLQGLRRFLDERMTALENIISHPVKTKLNYRNLFIVTVIFIPLLINPIFPFHSFSLPLCSHLLHASTFGNCTRMAINVDKYLPPATTHKRS